MNAGNLKLAGATLALAALAAGCSDSATSGSEAVSLEPMNYVHSPVTSGTVWACKFTVDPVSGGIINDFSSGAITAALVSGAGTVTAGPQPISWPTGPQCAKVWEGTAAASISVTETPDAGFALSFYKLATPTDQNPETRNYVNADQSPAPAGTTVNLNVDGSGQWEIWFKNVLYELPPPPPGGCTYTQGYWKTHSASGPAPYDDGWKNIGASEENTAFFTSGKTWLELWNTPPRGSAYIQLAHQYMAAKLNVLNGASAPADVASAIAAAETYFSTGTGSITGLATLLDQYNNGLVGPGHCSDETEG
jgi:hypothetical protein